MQAMDKPLIASRLLVLLASGGTLERVVTDLPMFREQLESMFDWMQRAGRCTPGVLVARAARLREVVRRKHQAIQRQEFEFAVKMREEEHRLFERFWLEAPRDATERILGGDLEGQIRDLSALLAAPESGKG
jgi:hypothetical protein